MQLQGCNPAFPKVIQAVWTRFGRGGMKHPQGIPHTRVYPAEDEPGGRCFFAPLNEARYGAFPSPGKEGRSIAAAPGRAIAAPAAGGGGSGCLSRLRSSQWFGGKRLMTIPIPSAAPDASSAREHGAALGFSFLKQLVRRRLNASFYPGQITAAAPMGRWKWGCYF